MTYPRKQQMVITDLDGTLLRSDRTFSKADLATLEHLGRCQILRVIATGRSLYSAYKVLPKSFPLDYLIFSSGAGIIDWQSQKLLVSHHLSSEEIAFALQLLMKRNIDFMLHYPIPDNHQFWYYRINDDNPDFIRRYQVYQEFATPFDLSSGHSLKKACQFVAIVPKHTAFTQYETVRAQLNMLKVIRATSPLDGESTWIEIFPTTVSKGIAGEWLAAQYQIGKTSILALGNDYNDLDLLQWAGKSFVVSNAPSDLKHTYNTVCTNNENGFSQAVKIWMNY